MPRVHHGKVRKDHPRFDIKKGEMAYWWTIKTGPVSGIKLYSKTPPKRSQLTHSAYQSAFADLEDAIAALSADDGLEDAVSEVASQFRELGDEQESNLSNMPEGLQQGDTGQLLESRKERCYEIADGLEGIDWSDKPDTESKPDAESKPEDAENAESADPEDYWQDKLDEVQGIDLTTD